MIPHLAARGRLIVASGALFIGVGALRPGTWPLVALGVLILSGMLSVYLWFYPTAVFLRRLKIELLWWVPPGDQPGGALVAGIPFALHLAMRNRGLRPLRVLGARIFASSAIQAPEVPAAYVPAGYEVELRVTLRALACGRWVLHGALVVLGDALGLYEIRAYFPSPIALEVFPKLGSPRGAALVARPEVGAMHERSGLHTVRRRGLAGELREIREHAPGDPFKFIAWKATARRRQLMVRELESEIVVTHQLLVDVAATMRVGPPGQTKLDYAIETAAGLARAGLDGGDRVGACTFDSRILALVKPGEGRPHFLKIVDKLIDAQRVVDADLTDMTDGELVATVARYLLHQEGSDLRILHPPPLHDPAWARIAAGPGGELYDLAALAQLVGAMLRGVRSPADELARLRVFCRVRGIELPYRQTWERGLRAAGFAEAVKRVAGAERAQLLVIFTDLEGVLDEPRTCLRALSLARRRRHQIQIVAPFDPAYATQPATLAGAEVARVLADEDRRRLDHARRQLITLGIPVVVAAPNETPDALARKLQRARPVARRG